MNGLTFKKSVFIFLCTGKGTQVEKRQSESCNTTILFGKTTPPASFFLTRIENFFYILFPYQSSMIKNNQARELREKESRRNETMATLYKSTNLNLWKKDSIALQISWKIDLVFFDCENSQYSTIILLLSKSDTSPTTKQVAIGLWHHNWNNTRRDFGRHHLTFSHYTFQDVSFLFLFPWIPKDFFLIKG